MPAIDLCSTVFIIRPYSHFTPQQFLGRMAHKLFLSMLDHIGLEALANSLHDQAERLPYSVSDLFPNGSQHFWMRVSGLTPSISAVIQTKLAAITGQMVTVAARKETEEAAWECFIEAVLPSQHEWARNQTYSELIRSECRAPRQRQLRLEFVTPTAIKSVGLYRPFPVPNWIFRPLYERLQRLEGVKLPLEPKPAYLEAYAEHFLRMQTYNLRCVTGLPMKDKAMTAFQGWIEYQVQTTNEDFGKSALKAGRLYRDEPLAEIYEHLQQHHDQYAALVHLLAQFAYYSGVGKYTGQGMGMVQLNERKGR
jgi:CRISPR/Cas system endoribonuclease Cas6 (RAMP superfamily)